MAESSGNRGSHPSPGGAYRTFRSLVESADRKFARVRDLPTYGRERHPHCQRKVFKAYTRVWRFQQEHRRELVAVGMQRWEIGEVASRIGQLYYGQYLRTSDVRFLLEAYVFYDAILVRGYFESGRKAAGRGQAAAARGKQQMLSDLGVRCKELRFYARFALVALLLDQREVVGKLVDEFRDLVDDCRVSFPGTNFKEWRQVLQEIARFSKAMTGFISRRPLRYSASFDSHSLSHSYVTQFRASRVLRLQEALLASYHRDEVKFSELTLDTFRVLQCLEWEPEQSLYQMNSIESTDNAAFDDQSAASGLININIVAEMTDTNLLSNPRKTILYHPSVSHLISSRVSWVSRTQPTPTRVGSDPWIRPTPMESGQPWVGQTCSMWRYGLLMRDSGEGKEKEEQKAGIHRGGKKKKIGIRREEEGAR
ncbi:hypothetical protein Taro_049280, partial [Colocasia esculenta]|nr:hypothetical protein [Colocasia esculenta]